MKWHEPASLTAHRLTPYSSYDNYREKDQLREALVGEQRGLCCYCLTRILPDTSRMKIEHWRSQENHSDQQLNYQNLLGSCKGGEGQPLALQHCDSRKGEADLQWNPANPGHHIETRITYSLDGTIHANDPLFDAELNNVLNLNLAFIKNQRKSVLTATLDWWKYEKRKLRRRLPGVSIERKIEQWDRPVGDLQPYCQIVIWWLRQNLPGMGQ